MEKQSDDRKVQNYYWLTSYLCVLQRHWKSLILSIYQATKWTRTRNEWPWIMHSFCLAFQTDLLWFTEHRIFCFDFNKEHQWWTISSLIKNCYEHPKTKAFHQHYHCQFMNRFPLFSIILPSWNFFLSHDELCYSCRWKFAEFSKLGWRKGRGYFPVDNKWSRRVYRLQTNG